MPTFEEMLAEERAKYQRKPVAALPTTPIEDQNRSVGDWIKDTAISAGGAALGIPQAAVGLAQLVPGLHYAADPLQEGLTAAREGLYGYQSPQAQAARQRLGQAIEEGRYWDAAGEAFTPANFADLALNAAASLGGMRAAGALAGRLGGRAGAAYSNLQPWQKAGLLEGVYTAGALGGGLSDTEEGYGLGRLAAIPAGALTGAIGGASARFLPDVEMAAALGSMNATQQMAARQAGGSLLQRMMGDPRAYVRVPMQGLKEGTEEFFQSGQESLWQNVGEGQPLNFNQALAEAMVGAVPGAVMGGTFGYFNRPGELPPAALPGARDFVGPMPTQPGVGGFYGPTAPTPTAPPTLMPSGEMSYPVGTDPYAAARQAQIDDAVRYGDVQTLLRQPESAPLVSGWESGGIRGTYTPYTAADRRAAMLERGRLAEQAAQRILNPQAGEVALEPLSLVGLATPAGAYQAQQSAAEAAAMRGLQANRAIAEQWNPWAAATENRLAREQEAWRQRQIDAAIAARQQPAPAPAPLTTGFAQPGFAPGPTTIEGQMAAEQRVQAAQEAAAAGQRATARGLAGEPIGEQQAMAFIIPENVPIPATTPQVQLLDADRLPLATVVEGVGIQPDLYAVQALKDKLGYDHERAVTEAVRQATIARLAQGTENPEAAKRAIATLEELNLDDKVNQQRLLSYIQQYPNATASQIEQFRTPGSKMYARKDLPGKGVLSYTQPQQNFPLFSDTIGPVEERTGAIPTKAERAAQTEALTTQATAQAQQRQAEQAAVRQVLAQTREQRMAAAAQQAAVARQAGTYAANPDFLQGGRGVEQGMRAEAAVQRSLAKQAVKPPKAPTKKEAAPPPKAPPKKVTPAATPVAAKGEATVTPAEKVVEPAHVTEAREFLAALEGGVATAAASNKMRRILEGFGLEVPKYQKASVKTQRIREALARYDGKPVEEAKTETVKSKAKEPAKKSVNKTFSELLAEEDVAETKKEKRMREVTEGDAAEQEKIAAELSKEDRRASNLAGDVIGNAHPAFQNMWRNELKGYNEKQALTMYTQFGKLLSKAYPEGVPKEITLGRLREILATLIKVRNEASKPQKGGRGKTEVAETPPVPPGKNPTVETIAALIDDPNRTDTDKIPDKTLADTIRPYLQAIANASDSFEKRANDLRITTAGKLSQDEINALVGAADSEVAAMNAAMDMLVETVDGGIKTLDNAQGATKKQAAAAGKNQTSPAIRFSRYFKQYRDNDGRISADFLADTYWRETNEAIANKKAADTADPNTDDRRAEDDGRFTTRTRTGKIALGENYRGDKKKVLDAANMALDGVYGPTHFTNEQSRQDAAKAHAAADFLLQDIISKRVSVFNKALAETVYNVLKKSGLLYRVKVEYYPNELRNGKVPSAQYVYEDGKHVVKIYGESVSQRDLLHELIHAATSAFIENNPNSAAAKIFRGMRELKPIRDHLRKVVDNYDQLSDADKTLEFIAYAITDNVTISRLRNLNINAKENKELFNSVKDYTRTMGERVYNLYKGFINVVKGILGIGPTDTNLNGFEAFMNTYAGMLTEVQQAFEGKGISAMQPNKSKSLFSTARGDALEQAYFEQSDERDAELARVKQIAAASRDTAPSVTLPPSRVRETMAGQSAVVEETTADMDAYLKRIGYKYIDAPARLMSAWMPGLWEKYAGKDNKYLREGIYKYVKNKPWLGRLMQNTVDGFGLPSLFVNNLRIRKNDVGIADHIAYMVNNDNKISFDKAMQEKFLAAVDDPTKETGKYWVDELAKAFRQAVDDARATNMIPESLKNAPYSQIFKWNDGEYVKQVKGFKQGFIREIFTKHNGRKISALQGFLGGTAPGLTYNGWVKQGTDSAGQPVYFHAFVNSALSDADQAKQVQDMYGPGYEKTSHLYYKINDNEAYRPYTFAEMRAKDEKASAIRSAAAFMQSVAHRMAGLEFAAEMINENAALKWDEKFLFENTEENITKLEGEVGKKRIIYFDEAKSAEDKKQMRTPGNFVVLRGAKWGQLDDYIVPSTVYSAIADYNNSEQFMPLKTVRMLNRFWKRNMTVWSTTAHVNNMMSSFITTYYHDIHPDDISTALKIIYKASTKPETLTGKEKAFYEEAMKKGALLGTFNVSEDIGGIMDEQMKALDEAKPDNSVKGYLAAATAMSGPMINGLKRLKDLGIVTDQILSDIYANEDNVFRLAAYIGKVREITLAKGGNVTEADLQAAGKWASDVMVNYDINARWVNIARQTFWPFIAWPYRWIGNMAKLAVTKPWKLMNTVAAFYLLDTLAYAMMGMGDDDKEWEKEVLPPYMKEGIWGLNVAPSYVRMPLGDGKDSGIFFGGARAIPLGDLTMANNGMFVPQIAAPGGPMALAMQAIFNRDVFHDKPIMDDFVTPGENFKSMMSFILRGSAPAVATRTFDVIDKAANDKRGPLGSEANMYVELARLMGLNVREVNFAEAAYNKSIADKNGVQKIKANMRRAINKELRNGVPDQDELQAIIDGYTDLRLNFMEQ